MIDYLERKKAEMVTGIKTSFDKARCCVEEGRYFPAIHNAELAECYAKKLGLDISNVVEGVKASAYQLAVDANAKRAQEAFNAGNITSAGIFVNLALAYADSGKIAAPGELLTIKAKIREIGNAMPSAGTGGPVLDELLASLTDGLSQQAM